MSAKYTLVPIVKESHVNPGESVDVDLFLSGHGDVKENKLALMHSHDSLFADNPGYIQHAVGIRMNDDGEVWITGGEEEPEESRKPMSNIGLHTVLHSGYFHENLNLNSSVPEELGDDVSGLPLLMAESAWVGQTPICIHINISDEARPGDYSLPLIFTYTTNDGQVRQSKESVDIHVNYPRERHDSLLTWGKVIAVLAALITLIIDASGILI